MPAALSVRIQRVLGGCLVLALGMAGALAQHDDPDQPHHHHPAAGAELTLELNDGERWETDEALRTGMRAIRQHFDAAHSAYRAGELDREAAALLAEQVDQQVQTIFTQCHLPAAADAQLHKLLAATLAATRTLRESENVHDGLHALHQVLESYGEHFEHPDWSANARH